MYFSVFIQKYQFYAIFSITYNRCVCPEGYKGNFCEKCIPGYYHENNGGPFARCIPCSCNGHTEFCDSETGAYYDNCVLMSMQIINFLSKEKC